MILSSWNIRSCISTWKLTDEFPFVVWMKPQSSMFSSIQYKRCIWYWSGGCFNYLCNFLWCFILFQISYLVMFAYISLTLGDTPRFTSFYISSKVWSHSITSNECCFSFYIHIESLLFLGLHMLNHKPENFPIRTINMTARKIYACPYTWIKLCRKGG